MNAPLPAGAARPAFDDAVHLMAVMGGGFVRALAECYTRADATNRQRLRREFSDYFGRYEQVYARQYGGAVDSRDCLTASVL